MEGAARRPVVGLFGAFDTGELGEVAVRRVIETELSRRRPDIEIVALAPFGAERPVPGDEGRPACPLPRRGAVATTAEGLGLDALIVAGDVLADDRSWAARYPVEADAIAGRGVEPLVLEGKIATEPAAGVIVWFGVGAPDRDVDVGSAPLGARSVWVRDPATLSRIGGTAVYSGDPLFLAARVFTAETVRKRADLLRLCGALPAGRRLVVEWSQAAGASDLADHVGPALSEALRADPKLVVIAVSLKPAAPGEGWPLGVDGLLAERLHHLPAWAGLDDVAAAISGSAAVIATSPAGADMAVALGAPVAAVTRGDGGRFDPIIPVVEGNLAAGITTLLSGGAPPEAGDAVRRLDQAFDELAERLPRVPGSAPHLAEREPVASALAILQQRLVDERTSLAAELSRLQAELDHLQASPEHRIAKPVRDAYQRWQRRRT